MKRGLLLSGLICAVCCGALAAEGDEALAQQLNRVRGMLDRSDVVLVGEIMRVKPPPLAFTGTQWVAQTVDYKVVEMLAGAPRLDRATVEHPITYGSSEVTPKGRLLPLKYRRGNRLILFLERRKDGRTLIATGPSLPYDEASLELLRKAGLKW